MSALFNEVDPYAARWLRKLVVEGHITHGSIDERSIEELTAADLEGVGQFHAFAGIGVWSHAARLAGWPDDFPLWTGSCPCQPFSVAGSGEGFADERHLWPEWFRLIRECRPPVVVGEQVASADGLAWLDAVHADLEAAGYAVGAFDLCAASVGAPHRRQRLYFAAVRIEGVEDTRRRLANHHEHRRGEFSTARVHEDRQRGNDAAGRGALGGLADADVPRWRAREGQHETGRAHRDGEVGGGLVHTDGIEPRRNAGAATCEETEDRREGSERRRGGLESVNSGATGGFWADVEWLDCRDGRRRPTQPGVFPLADGVAARVGKLRAYGNAIVGPLATAFLGCLRDSLMEAA